MYDLNHNKTVEPTFSRYIHVSGFFQKPLGGSSWAARRHICLHPFSGFPPWNAWRKRMNR